MISVLSSGNTIRRSEIGTPGGGVVSGTGGFCGLPSLRGIVGTCQSLQLSMKCGARVVLEFCWMPLIFLFRKGIVDKDS